MTARLFSIRGTVQEYDWGGYSYIRSLLGKSEKPSRPSAEYWLGTHPNAPSMAIHESGEEELGVTLRKSGQPPLSFLMKILDVRMMLSIQVHPSREQAGGGYDREQAAGISLGSKERTYRDRNHKPELMFALSRFWMLHGLQTSGNIERALRSHAACKPLLEILRTEGIEALVAVALQPDHPVTRQVVPGLLADIADMGGPLDKLRPEFWIRRWLRDNPESSKGLLMIFLMNIVELQPGEAIYQPERLLHAYLEGQNVEIMANSDNVLRAGLTSKHVDPGELLKVANLEPTDAGQFKVNVSRDRNGIRSFDTPYDDFLLQEIEIPPLSSREIVSSRPQVLLFFSGEQLSVSCNDCSIAMLPGQSLFSCINNVVTFHNPTSRTAQVFIGS